MESQLIVLLQTPRESRPWVQAGNKCELPSLLSSSQRQCIQNLLHAISIQARGQQFQKTYNLPVGQGRTPCNQENHNWVCDCAVGEAQVQQDWRAIPTKQVQWQ